MARIELFKYFETGCASGRKSRFGCEISMIKNGIFWTESIVLKYIFPLKIIFIQIYKTENGILFELEDFLEERTIYLKLREGGVYDYEITEGQSNNLYLEIDDPDSEYDSIYIPKDIPIRLVFKLMFWGFDSLTILDPTGEAYLKHHFENLMKAKPHWDHIHC